MVGPRAGDGLRILCVCTANICRSASAERLLLDSLAEDPALAGVEVRSAGTHATVGAPGCPVAPALVGHAAGHRSTPLSAALVDWADLVLAAARDHRSVIVALDPSVRPRTFTLRQVGRVSDWLLEAGIVAAARERAGTGASEGVWAERLPAGDPRAAVPALPAAPADRWDWLVGELDAARVMAAVASHGGPVEPAPGVGRRAWSRRRGSMRDPAGARADDTGHPDDIPDPHVLGFGLHPLAHEQLRAATGSLVRLLRKVSE